MHHLLLKLLTALLALMLLGATPSFAEHIQPMSAHPSASSLAGSCAANGGSFSESNDLGFHNYSCTKSNCDGKGGTCSVNCGDKGCTGVTPMLLGNANIRMILQAGSLVNHIYADDDGSQTPNHPTGTPAPAAPVPGAPSFL